MAQKTVYVCDGKDGVFGSTKFVDEGYQLAVNESFEMPPVGLYEPKLVNRQWQGLTEEEMKAKHPEWFPSAGPSQADKAMNTLGLQVAQLTKENNDLKKSINTLGLQFAQAISADKKENGGN